MHGADGRRATAAVEPRWRLQLWTSAGSNEVWVPVSGLSLGFVWKLGQRFALVPDIAAYRSPVAIDYSRGSHFGVGRLY